MAEIAIALGVIAFALIAIVAVLPAGLQVQRDNREETIINQDARLLLQAIRSGGRDDSSELGLFVVATNRPDGVMVPTPGGIPTIQLVRHLSQNDPTRANVALFSAISGGVANRGLEDFGFRYQVMSHVMNPLATNLFGEAAEFDGGGVRLTNQLYDVRLRFSWPLLPDGTLASQLNRYVARTLVAGWHTNGLLYSQEFVQPAP